MWWLMMSRECGWMKIESVSRRDGFDATAKLSLEPNSAEPRDHLPPPAKQTHQTHPLPTPPPLPCRLLSGLVLAPLSRHMQGAYGGLVVKTT